jgi:signal transduction histidine kinase
LGLFVVSVPALYAQRSAPPEAVRLGLAELGLPAGFYATYWSAVLVVFALACLAVAAVIFRRRSDDGLALLASLFLVLLGTVNAPNMQALGKAYPALALPTQCMLFLTVACLLLFLCLFPDGRFVPRWTRVFMPAWLGLLMAAAILTGDSLAEPAGVWVAVAILGGLSIGLAAQVYRYARVSDRPRRQQTKWVVFGVAVAIAGQVVFPLLVEFFPSLDRPGSAALLYELTQFTGVTGSYLFVPLTIGVAILQHRLWDIEVVINRTLVYSALTTIVVALYVLVVGGLGALLRVQGNLLVSILAAGLVAVLFAPLRDRLQRGVDRLLYGERDDPYAVLSRLGQRLEVSLAPEVALSTIVETVAQALKLPYAGIFLDQDGEFVMAAEYGEPVDEPITLPLAYQTEPVGRLVLAPRSPGEAFSPADERLLEDIARQAGVAAHAVRLNADLQRSRERLVTAREEERRRLRRDLHDGLGAQLAGLNVQAGVLRNLIPRDPAAADELVVELRGELRASIADVRRLVHDLRPPALDELGLESALRRLAERYGEGLRVRVETPEGLPSLPAAVEVAVYRISQEALTNVVRHARAKVCVVRLTVNGGVGLEITDDGIGLPEERAAGVGLVSMRERAAELGGRCTVERMPQGGTRVLVWLPLSKG